MARGRPPLRPGEIGQIRARRQAGGRWKCDVRARPLVGDPVRHRVTARTRAEAERKAREMAEASARRVMGEEQQHAALGPASTVADLVGAYLADAERLGTLTPATLTTYRSASSSHITPALGGTRLDHITPGALAAWVQALTPGTWRTCRAILQGAWAWARRRDHVAGADPTTAMPAAPRAARDVQALTPDQAAAWVTACREHHAATGAAPDAAPLSLFLLGSGLRIAEALQLRWEDITWDAGGGRAVVTYTPGKARARTARAGAGERRRRVTLPTWAAEALREQRQATSALGSPWVWVSAAGTPRTAANVRRDWRAVRARAGEGIPAVTPHLLRHTCATWIAPQDLYLAQRQLGHAGIATTQDYYIAELEATDAAGALEAAWSPGGH